MRRRLGQAAMAAVSVTVISAVWITEHWAQLLVTGLALLIIGAALLADDTSP